MHVHPTLQPGYGDARMHPEIGTVINIQYCAKVTQVKCANFVLCSRDFSTKIRMKVRVKFHGVSSDNSLKQRAIFLRSFVKVKKIHEQKR